MVIGIEYLSQIPTQTSKWDSEHVVALNIEYKNVLDIIELINPIELNDNDNFQNVIKNEDADPTRETRVGSFIMTLLGFLGFDEDPFLLHPQYNYSVYVDKEQHRITSTVEFMITKDDTCIVLISEDKHPKNISEMSDWSEPQIAGEIFGAAYHNTNIDNNKKVTYPFNIYAIRIIGTEFTFYKSIITREYMKEAVKRVPQKQKLEIKRFPQQPTSLPNQGRELKALDFTKEGDRILILSIMKGLYEINK
ncbi:unnamed protein product [Cunninghamella echinulata]